MIELRPQQVKFENAIRTAFTGNRRVLAVAPTGFGKGVVIGDMALKAAQKGRKVLLVTNRRVIVLQLTEHCQRAGIDTGVIMADVERSDDAQVQVASIQTLERRGFARFPSPGFILLDEAHNCVNSYQRLICERFPDVPVLGMTATPVGPGGSRLSHFETIIEPVKNSEVIAAGHLLRVHPYLAPSEPDLGGLDLKSASKDDVGERVSAVTIYGDVFKEWEPYRHMRTLVAFPTRAICNAFHRHCMHHGIKARVVDGTTEQAERNEIFSEFKEGDCEMILGVDVIGEGLDLPRAQCLIDLHPTHQFRRYWQLIGRVKRLHPGQETAVIIDLAGNLWRHMVHPDQDPPWDEVTTDKTIEDVIERKAGVRCPSCGSKDIYSVAGIGYKCEECGNTWQTTRPFVCPHCKQGLGPHQKVTNGKCPNCGANVSSKPIRRIRMADGSIRTVPADEIKRRKKCKANKEQTVWDKWRYIANAKGKTLDFARVMYQREMGEWPKGLKNCPESSTSGDWKRRPSDVYPWMKKKGQTSDDSSTPSHQPEFAGEPL